VTRSLYGLLKGCYVAMAVAGPAIAPAVAQPRDANSPLKIVVPFSPGSGTDVIARLVGKALGDQLKRQVVIENKPGAAGTVAAQAVLAEPADGHTLMMVSSAFAVLPASGRKLPFNPEADFETVGVVARSANVLITSKATGFASVADLVRAGKSKADGLTFASSGVGSGTHLNAEYFVSVSGIRALHIPMRGGPEIMGEIIGGRVDFAFVPPSQIAPIGADKFTALAVTGANRVASVGQVPALAEAGFAGFEYHLWYALLARAGTPAVALDPVHVALPRAMGDAAVVTGFQALSIEPQSLVKAAARDFVRDEIAKNRSLVKARGIQLND